MTTQYCLGFLFDEDYRAVMLIRKARPDWQKGKLNGVGGHVEEGEEPLQAMAREFKEETGASIAEGTWRCFGALEGTDFRVHLFYTTLPAAALYSIWNEAPKSGEQVGLYHPFNLASRGDVLSNVPWLVHMAMSFHRGERATSFIIKEL